MVQISALPVLGSECLDIDLRSADTVDQSDEDEEPDQPVGAGEQESVGAVVQAPAAVGRRPRRSAARPAGPPRHDA